MTPLFLSLLLGSTPFVPAEPVAPKFLVGGDVSEIPEVEAAGGKYTYKGKTGDVFQILKKAGWNFVRFRVWNAPREGYCDIAHTLEMAKRAKAAGMTISIDFHYSDWWADPGKQNKPAAWKSLSQEDLAKAVYDYTKDVVGGLVDQGTRPYMVQIGNEITPGMLWPEGRLKSDDSQKWKDLAQLVNAGIRAVHDVQGKTRILTMIHLDRGGDNKASRWWFDHAIAEGIDFDTIGLSYYPFWHGTLEAMTENVNDLATRYGKPVYIVETAYPWTIDKARGPGFAMTEKLVPGYDPNPEGQAKFVSKVIDIVRQVPDGRGRGVLYWAPTWISTPKNHIPWSNMALFDDSGNALPGVDAMGGKRH